MLKGLRATHIPISLCASFIPQSLMQQQHALNGTQHAWRCFSFKRNLIRRLPRLSPVLAAPADFFSAGEETFVDMGIGPRVQEALHMQGFNRPSRVQEMVMPVLAKGRNAVIAAETGSGKTLAYLAPIATMLLRQRERIALDDTGRERLFHALVLCPNVALCQQVLAVASSLRSPDGSPLLSAAYVNASNPPPQETPELIISTPAAMMGFITGPGPEYGFIWSDEGLPQRVRHVVLDEADMLLGRAFEKPVNQLLQLFRSHDRRRVEAKVFQELGMNKQEFDRLPRQLQVACWREGALGLKNGGYRLPGGWDAHDPASFGPYWRRQYVFVAATMPSITLSDVGSEIERMFPDVQWLSSELLHQNKPTVQHAWQEVGDTTFRKALVSAICDDPDYAAGTAKVLIFAGETAAADELSEVLHQEGLDHVVYHKGRPTEERAAALEAMSRPPSPQGQARLMVCTDAAARGLDIQDVSHVIQADFAPNAIDFIHRIGRTARAGRSGKVTSLYRKHNVALVQVLRQYMEEGRPLEAAFSRARSFSRKLKRKGEFVPRGMTRAQYQQHADDPGTDGADGAVGAAEAGDGRAAQEGKARPGGKVPAAL